VESFAISLDGYGAGPKQDISNPLGVGGDALHQWALPTRTFQRALFGADSGATGVDDDFAARGFKNVGAWILGRNMFGPTFYFVTGGIHEALEQAREAAKGMDVRIGGGPNTIRQYLRAGLIDELHLAIAPVLLGEGERFFEGVDLRGLGYECIQFVASEKATHVVLRRQT
jgi:dihydrofolate reductase